jgi:hypothetical protein
MAPVGIQTNIERIVSPEAASENGPGADLYTYVDRTEPKAISQHSPPTNTGSRNAAGQTFLSPDSYKLILYPICLLFRQGIHPHPANCPDSSLSKKGLITISTLVTAIT